MDLIKVLENHGLTNRKNLLADLQNCSDNYFRSLLDELDAFYKTLPTPHELSNLEPLTFCFPSFPAEMMNNISPYMLFSDRVFVDDPIYDIISFLESWNEVLDSDVELSSLPIFRLIREGLLNEIVKIIPLYSRARGLIIEGKFVPYKKTDPWNYMAPFKEFMINIINNKDLRMLQILSGDESKSAAMLDLLRIKLLKLIVGKYGVQGRAFFFLLPKIVPIGRAEKYLLQIKSAPLILSLLAVVGFGGVEGCSTDFLHPNYAYMYRRVLEVFNQLCSELPPHKASKLPVGFSLNQIAVPILRDVPIERVLDIISKHPTSYLAFRSALNEKLLQITAPPGSIERERQIAAIQLSTEKNMADIKLVYDETRKTFSKKMALNCSLGVSSIAVAGLSAASQNLDALAIASSVFSGATFSASVREIVKEWLSYQKEMQDLKQKNDFFIWKYISPKK